MKTLPCPHCGKQPALFQNEDPYGPGGPIPTDWTIQCCAVMTADTKEQAIAWWNKRFNCTKRNITMTLPKLMNETYVFMEDARKMIGTAKSYYQMFAIYEIPYIYVMRNGRKSKAFLLSAVNRLAKDVQKHKIGRI